MKYIYKDVLGGIDMDQVLTDWDSPESGFLKIVRELLPNIPHKRLKEYTSWEASDNYPKEIKHIVSSIYDNPRPGFFYELQPIPGSIEAVKRLQDKMEIVIVSTPVFEMDGHVASLEELTERDRLWAQAVEEKKLWLRKHFGVDAPPLNPLSDKTIFHGDFLVDDKPTASKIKRRIPSWIHILYDDGYLYNRHAKNKYRMSWNNYKEVIPKVVEEIKRKRGH